MIRYDLPCASHSPLVKGGRGDITSACRRGCTYVMYSVEPKEQIVGVFVTQAPMPRLQPRFLVQEPAVGCTHKVSATAGSDLIAMGSENWRGGHVTALPSRLERKHT
jgi:hypothetical protein